MSVDKTNLVAIRNVNHSDRNFILATWLRGLRYGNEWYQQIESKAYFHIYHQVVNNLLNRPGVTVKVACLKDDPEVILGYSVSEGTRLHWVQVKSAWRNIGLANSLVSPEITTATHLTRVGKSILIKKNLIFNPFLTN